MSTTTLPTTRVHMRRSHRIAPPINTEILLSRCMGKASFALILLGELESNGKQQVDTLVLHSTNDNLAAAAEVAHSLKGSAAIIGAEQLHAKAIEVEEAAHSGKISLLLNRVQELREEMDRCLAWIPTFRLEIERPSAFTS